MASAGVSLRARRAVARNTRLAQVQLALGDERTADEVPAITALVAVAEEDVATHVPVVDGGSKGAEPPAKDVVGEDDTVGEGPVLPAVVPVQNNVAAEAEVPGQGDGSKVAEPPAIAVVQPAVENIPVPENERNNQPVPDCIQPPVDTSAMSSFDFSGIGRLSDEEGRFGVPGSIAIAATIFGEDTIVQGLNARIEELESETRLLRQQLGAAPQQQTGVTGVWFEIEGRKYYLDDVMCTCENIPSTPRRIHGLCTECHFKKRKGSGRYNLLDDSTLIPLSHKGRMFECFFCGKNVPFGAQHTCSRTTPPANYAEVATVRAAERGISSKAKQAARAKKKLVRTSAFLLTCI